MFEINAESTYINMSDHVNRITVTTQSICKHIHLSSEETNKICSFSRIHDIGKINVPEKILNKPGKLSIDEWHVMRSHTITGEKIITSFTVSQTAREIVRSHHENWDGTGYPDGLSGYDIPLSARIVAIADVYDALSNARPYKKAWEKKRVVLEIEKLSNHKFDPEIIKIFLSKCI